MKRHCPGSSGLYPQFKSIQTSHPGAAIKSEIWQENTVRKGKGKKMGAGKSPCPPLCCPGLVSALNLPPQRATPWPRKVFDQFARGEVQAWTRARSSELSPAW